MAMRIHSWRTWTCICLGMVGVSFSIVRAAPSARDVNNLFCRGATSQTLKAARVGPPIRGVALALQRKQVAPGQVIRARLVNVGEHRATYGPPHRIEHWAEGRWSLDPSSPRGPWHKVFWLLRPTQAGRCFQFAIPSEQAVGVYRFVVPAETDKGRAARTAIFHVD
jgi:hypothetical protein